MPAIENEIRAFIIQNFLFGTDDDSLSADDSFLDKGIIDSTGVLEFVAFLEQHYQFKIADEELIPDNLDSIRKARSFIQRKTGN